MRIHSIFYSVDGEVNFMGQGTPSVFLRLQGCNMNPPCSWCDTKDSLDPDKYWKDLPPLEVKNMLLDFFPSSMKGPKITITGGEPLLQEDEVHVLLNYLFQYGIKISIETNGTVSLEKFLRPKPNPDICLVVDWKPRSARPSKYFDWLNRAEYDKLRPWDWIKFPVASRDDYEQARDFIRQLDTKARIAISPIMAKESVIERMVYKPFLTHKQIFEWLRDDGLHEVCLNVQLHKFLNLA